MNRKAHARNEIVGAILSVAVATLWPPSAIADRPSHDGSATKKQTVQPLFGLAKPSDGPFPADRFTVADPTQNTCERMNLPKPEDCAANLYECVQTDLINEEMDGFNLQTRLSIPFSGPIDLEKPLINLATVNSATIFLVSLGSSLADGVPDCAIHGDNSEDEEPLVSRPRSGWVVGINKVMWEFTTNTLYAEADEMLEQHTRYALVVTRAVMDKNGNPIEPSKAFKRAIGDEQDDGPAVADAGVLAYQRSLRSAVAAVRLAGVRRHDIAVLSVFTTMSVTWLLEKVRDQIAAAAAPAPIDFHIGPAGSNGPPMVFDLGAIIGMTFNRQMFTTAGPGRCAPSTAPCPANLAPRLDALRIVPGAVAKIAFGQYRSPNYLRLEVDSITGGTLVRIPAVGTYSGVPQVQTNGGRPVRVLASRGSLGPDRSFVVFTPSGTQPADGWPVVIFGHGSGDTMLGSPFNVAAKMASHGLATIAIHSAVHGFGPDSTVTVTRSAANGGAVTFSAGGRSFDANNDGSIAADEGSLAGGSRGLLLSRHSGQQTVADLMQLVREIQAGVDVDGNGVRDLDPSHIYYAGTSAGATQGVLLFSVLDDIRAASFTGISGRANPADNPVGRGAAGQGFANRVPPLVNLPGEPLIPDLGGVPVAKPWFNESALQRDAAPLENKVPGAVPIQDQLERINWLGNGGGGRFARHLRLAPLPGVSARPFLVQESRGDPNVPNPSTAQFVQAGLLADRVTLYRHDMFASTPERRKFFPNPHSFLIRTDNLIADVTVRADMQKVSLMAQDQVGAFFESDVKNDVPPKVTDPDGAGPLFEVPAAKIWEDYGFILVP